MPAGPAPTMTTSYGASPRLRPAIVLIAWRPCIAALRISPMPPSSPTMKTPGTLVSNLGSTWGMSTPRRSEPNTSVIADTGQEAAQAPCPMQSVGLVSTALPPTTPSAPSGHARSQPPEPMHRVGSTTGCSDAGSVIPSSRTWSEHATVGRVGGASPQRVHADEQRRDERIENERKCSGHRSRVAMMQVFEFRQSNGNRPARRALTGIGSAAP